MKAMLLEKTVDLGVVEKPLRLADVVRPESGPEEARIKVSVCAVCHTELDEIEGRTPPLVLPVISGHQVLGDVDTMAAKPTTCA